VSVGGALTLEGTVDVAAMRETLGIPDELSINLHISVDVDENMSTDSGGCYVAVSVGGQEAGSVTVDVEVSYLEIFHATSGEDAGALITALGLMGQREAVVAKLFDTHGVAVLAEALDEMSTGSARESMLDELEALLKAHRG
tara:strand:+ start:111 stop:536 length:426 start_codon:yes stop_codon:yes gene_type:complete